MIRTKHRNILYAKVTCIMLCLSWNLQSQLMCRYAASLLILILFFSELKYEVRSYILQYVSLFLSTVFHLSKFFKIKRNY